MHHRPSQRVVVLPLPSHRLEGTFVDARLSETRDMEGAQHFFRQAVTIVGHCPARVRLMAMILSPRRAGDAG